MHPVYTLTADTNYARNKRKAIKQNNGFCPNCPKTEAYRCKCEKFRNMDHDGWCDEGLYYKEFIKDDEDEGDEANAPV